MKIVTRTWGDGVSYAIADVDLDQIRKLRDIVKAHKDAGIVAVETRDHALFFDSEETEDDVLENLDDALADDEWQRLPDDFENPADDVRTDWDSMRVAERTVQWISGQSHSVGQIGTVEVAIADLEHATQIKYAACGTDGTRMIVWGLGTTEEDALADANAQDFGGDEFKPDFTVHVISAADAARVIFGQAVACVIHGNYVVLIRE